MPPQLATFLTFILIFYLFWVDFHSSRGLSKALWIPFLWMFFAGSRYVAQWLDLGTAIDPLKIDLNLEGNPWNAYTFLILTIAGLIVLTKRKIRWGDLLTNNVWLGFFYVYCLISILWADYPFVSFKRFFKTIGDLTMALIILTDEQPDEALALIIRKLSFLFLPLSILFIKYYPDLGRAYHYHMGIQMFTGVALQKNSLGQLCLISGMYLSWELMLNQCNMADRGRKIALPVYLLVLPMIAWLLYMSNSSTSLVCLFSGIFILLLGRTLRGSHDPRGMIVRFGIIGILFAVAIQLLFGISSDIISLLGRDESLTTRVPMWEELLANAENPLIGVGFEMFWSGERTKSLLKFGVLQAHNGYLDLYLNIGIIGLFLMVLCILTGLRNALKLNNEKYSFSMLKISLIVVFILYNWTESAFKPVSNMFILFLLGIISMPFNSIFRNKEMS